MQRHFVKKRDGRSHLSVDILMDIRVEVSGAFSNYATEGKESIEATMLHALEEDGFKRVELSRFGIQKGERGRSRTLHEITLLKAHISELERYVRELTFDQGAHDEVSFTSFIPGELRKIRETLEEVEERISDLNPQTT